MLTQDRPFNWSIIDLRIHLPDICLTGSMCYDERKIYCQEGALYGSTKQETRNT